MGCIGLVPIGDEHYPVDRGEREIGYWIGLPFWNQGLTTEALIALMDDLSGRDDVESLLITVDTTNIASQRVAEKCGFEQADSFEYEGIRTYAYRKQL